MRKIWTAMKLFQVPINHPYIQNLTSFDLSFIEWSTALDDPKFRAKMENTFYDEDFDEFWDDPNSDLWDEDFNEYSDEIVQPEQPDSAQFGEEPTNDETSINEDINTAEKSNYDFTEYEDDDFTEIPEGDSEEIQDWEVVDNE